MKKSIFILVIVQFLCSFVCGQEKQVTIPTEEQVQKLVIAAWKEPIKSIDILYYEDYTGVSEPAEQIRKRAEETADKEFKGRSIDRLEPYEKERRNKNIEINFKNWIENQTFPRKIKEHVLISGDKQRSDFVKVGTDEQLDQNTPFVHTFVNTKDVNTGDFVSYHYANEIKTVYIRSKKWNKKTIGQFGDLSIAGMLQICLGSAKDSASASSTLIPDPNKMAKLAKTGLLNIEPTRGVKMETLGVNRISIYPDSNALHSRDIIERV